MLPVHCKFQSTIHRKSTNISCLRQLYQRIYASSKRNGFKLKSRLLEVATKTRIARKGGVCNIASPDVSDMRSVEHVTLPKTVWQRKLKIIEWDLFKLVQKSFLRFTGFSMMILNFDSAGFILGLVIGEVCSLSVRLLPECMHGIFRDSYHFNMASSVKTSCVTCLHVELLYYRRQKKKAFD